jgi:hypothetical protein
MPTERRRIECRPVKGGEVQIDPDRPVVIKKRQKIASTKDVFVVINALKAAHGKIRGSLSATVGQGDVNATTRTRATAQSPLLQDAPAKISADAAVAEVQDVLDSIGDTCPECPSDVENPFD